MKIILATLLLVSTASADGPFLGGGGWPAGDEVQSSAGPLFSIWHIDGHGYQWQQAQIDAGYPVEPSIRMINAALREGGAIVDGVPKQIGILNGNAPLLSRMNNGPIVLRMNNITGEIDATIPRMVLTEENWRESVLCVRRKIDGTLDQTPEPNPVGPVCKWQECGRLWATGAWMRRLQEIVPSPTEIILRENNEGERVKFKELCSEKSEKVKLPDGTRVTVVTLAWLPRANLESKSLQLADWVDERRNRKPEDCESEFHAAENALYHALYAAFDAELTDGWRGKLRTVGYGSFDENHQNTTASIALYLGWYSDSLLTSPQHEQALASYQADWQTSAWRELSVDIVPPAVIAGHQSQQHAIVDPESCAGFFTAMAWRMQSPGKEVRLVWWDNANTLPTQILVAPKPNVAEYLLSIGRTDVANATVEDYELALLRQLKRIADHPTINRYWREGTTRVLACPLNDATANRVYATETEIPGVAQTLLFVYTPCDLSGEIEVGAWTVRAKRCGYWLTGSVQEIE